MDPHDSHAEQISEDQTHLAPIIGPLRGHPNLRATTLTIRTAADTPPEWSATITTHHRTDPPRYGTITGTAVEAVTQFWDDIEWLLAERLRLQGLLVDANGTIYNLTEDNNALVATLEHHHQQAATTDTPTPTSASYTRDFVPADPNTHTPTFLGPAAAAQQVKNIDQILAGLVGAPTTRSINEQASDPLAQEGQIAPTPTPTVDAGSDTGPTPT